MYIYTGYIAIYNAGINHINLPRIGKEIQFQNCQRCVSNHAQVQVRNHGINKFNAYFFNYLYHVWFKVGLKFTWI